MMVSEEAVNKEANGGKWRQREGQGDVARGHSQVRSTTEAKE
jgi:hypothetical protein